MSKQLLELILFIMVISTASNRGRCGVGTMVTTDAFSPVRFRPPLSHHLRNHRYYHYNPQQQRQRQGQLSSTTTTKSTKLTTTTTAPTTIMKATVPFATACSKQQNSRRIQVKRDPCLLRYTRTICGRGKQQQRQQRQGEQLYAEPSWMLKSARGDSEEEDDVQLVTEDNDKKMKDATATPVEESLAIERKNILNIFDGGVVDQEMNQSSLSVIVRRKYETFLWFYNLQEYSINYRVEGPIDGQRLLLVHGFGANVNHFRFQFQSLPQLGYRVYAIDLLGFGASDKPAQAGYSIELFVALLKDFVQTMHINNQDQEQKPWFIAGNSIGGLCVLSLAEQLPNLIQGCILFNCAGGMTGFRYQDVPIFIRPVLWFIQTVALGPTWGNRFFQNFKTRSNVEGILKESGVYQNTTNVNEELFDILLAPSNDDGAQDVFLEVFAGPPGPTPESILPNVQCPILALWGSADPWTPLDAGAHPGNQFGQYVTSSSSTTSDDEQLFTLHVLPGAGHCPHDEVPDACHAVMIPWMERVKENYQPPPTSTTTTTALSSNVAMIAEEKE